MTYHVYANDRYLGKIISEDTENDQFYNDLRAIEVKDVQMDIYSEKDGELEWDHSTMVCSAR